MLKRNIQMHPGKRVAINTGFLYVRMAITVFISLYATRLILNALGSEDFGLFNVVGGAVTMLTFLNIAMATATQRFISYAQGEGNYEKQHQIFNVSLVLHFIIAILVVLLLEVAGYFLFNGILTIPTDRIGVAKIIFQFMLVSTFFTIVSVPYDAVINAHENMFLVAVLGIIEAIIKLVIAIYITQTSTDKLISYGLFMAILAIFVLVLRQVYCHKKYKEVQINFKKYFSKPLFKEIMSFAGWSLMGTTSSVIASYGQGIVINMFFGTIVNAAQGIANQVSGQLGAFSGTMLKALNPLIAKSEGAGNRALMIEAAMFGSKTSFFLLMLTFIPVIIEMPYIFNLWLKNVPDFTVIFCRLLLIRNLIEQMYATLTNTISAVGNIRRFQIVASVLYFLPILVSYFIFKLHYPAYSLYIVFLVFSILTSVVVIYFAKVNFNLSIFDYFKIVVSPSIGSFIFAFIFTLIPYYLMDPGFIRFILVSIMSTISSFIAIWFIGFSADERKKIFKIFNGISSILKIKSRAK